MISEPEECAKASPFTKILGNENYKSQTLNKKYFPTLRKKYILIQGVYFSNSLHVDHFDFKTDSLISTI